MSEPLPLLTSMPPGCAPGGLWVRMTCGAELVTSHAVLEAGRDGAGDAQLALDASLARGGRPVIWSLYDGDSGMIVGQQVVAAHPEAEL